MSSSVIDYKIAEIDHFSKINSEDDECVVHFSRDKGKDFFDIYFETPDRPVILSQSESFPGSISPPPSIFDIDYLSQLMSKNSDIVIRVFSLKNGDFQEGYSTIFEDFCRMEPNSIRKTEGWLTSDEREFLLHGEWYLADCLGTTMCEPISLLFLNYYYDLKAYLNGKSNEDP